jgi:hypothetical protein
MFTLWGSTLNFLFHHPRENKDIPKNNFSHDPWQHRPREFGVEDRQAHELELKHVEGWLDLVWIDCWTRVCYLSDSLWPIWATGSNIHIQLAEERQRGSIPRSVQVRSSAKNYKYKLLLANWQIIRLLLTCSYQNATCCFSECDEKKPSTVKIGNLLIDYVL